MVSIVYSPHYRLGWCGLADVEAGRAGRIWRWLRERIGPRLDEAAVRPARPVLRGELLDVHPADYLLRLKHAGFAATALGRPGVRYWPAALREQRLLRPLRWGAMGTVLAARAALRDGVAVNLTGGWQQAGPQSGGAGCVYADVPLAIHQLRAAGLLRRRQEVVCVDLNAQLGRGTPRAFRDDPRVRLFDLYNAALQRPADRDVLERIDCSAALPAGSGEEEYFAILAQMLPPFLDSLRGTAPLAIYTAGGDPLAGDPHGGLGLSPAGLLARDAFVIDELRRRGLAVALLPGAGTTRAGAQLFAASVQRLLERG